MADPFTLISLGLGAAGSLASGIYGAATADDRKKEWLAEQQRAAQLQAIRNSRMTNFWNTNSIDAQHRKNAVEKEAEERFQVDPMTFLPFVQQGTQLAGGIYDAATEKPKGVGTRSGVELREEDFYAPEQLEYYNPNYRGRSW
jgi:hypothetical protein